MKYFLISLMLIFFWTSCAMDFTANAEIENLRANDIEVSFYYRRDFLDSLYRGDSSKYLFFLKNASDQKGGTYQIDTSTLVVRHILKQKQTLLVSHVPGGRNVRPEYIQYDSIDIRFDDNKISKSAAELSEIFKEKETRYWVWTIH